MKKFRQLFASFLPLLLMAALLAGNAQAALLDLGPTVLQVPPNAVPYIGHGFPLWYRDTNRVPLELCVNEAMCLFARPNPAIPSQFPNNVPDELFFYSAGATIPTPAGTGDLFAGVEANILTESDGSLTLISFARVRIRIDTNVAGTYVVTTPFKQYTFNNVPVGTRGINFTEDIGIGPSGHFDGALAGSIGPFVYCSDAPFPASDATGGSYIGHNATTCAVQGSTFIPPGQSLPANYFRVQGPAGFGDLQTTAFNVTGKLYTAAPTPTPLTVDKATYSLDTTGMQVNAFATTQALSNQTNPAAAFPLNFALTGVPSTLQVAGTGISTQVLTTNSPADGKFFSTNGPFTAPGSVPTSVTVTNTADTPNTSKVVPLVDQVVIDKADYNPLTKTLSITAFSYDSVNNPALQAFIAGTEVLLGTLSNGQLDVTFPVTIGAVPLNRTYNIPPLNVTVQSAKLGSATVPVNVAIPSVPPSPLAIATASPVTSYAVGSGLYNGIIAATGGTPPYTFFNPVGGTGLPSGISLFPNGQLFGGGASVAGTYTFNVAVFDSNSGFATKSFTLVVTSGPLTITTASPLPSNIIGGGVYNGIINATGGTGPYTFSITAGALPAGISLFSNGQLFGGGSTVAGTYNFTVTVTDSTLATASQAFTLQVL